MAATRVLIARGAKDLHLIAVPTSVGYGTAFEGQTALASMMTSCAPGIAVIGIDNGYGAACAAHRFLRRLGPSSA